MARASGYPLEGAVIFIMVDPMTESGGTDPRPDPEPQMDPRPLDNTITVQDAVSSWDVAIVQSQRIRKLNSYWHAKAKGKVPSRSDIDPVDVRELLPNLMMIDMVGEEPVRFRYRLVGTRVVQYTGFDFTGRCLDEMVFQGRDFIEHCYRRMLAEKRPIFGHYAWLVRSRHFGQCEFGLFPLSDDGVTVNRGISIEDYERMERDILTYGQGAPMRRLAGGG